MKESIILVISVISDYQATDNGYLQKHIHPKHERVKYPCSKCDYKATTQRILKTHFQSKHERQVPL